MHTLVTILDLQFFGAHINITVISAIVLYLNALNVLLSS